MSSDKTIGTNTTAATERAAAGSRALDVQFAAMSLGWSNPHGEQLAPWLAEVKSAGYAGVAGFAFAGMVETFYGQFGDPAAFKSMLDEHGLALASVDVGVAADFDFYRQVCNFMAAVGGRHLVCLGGTGRADGDFATVGALLNRIGEIAHEYGLSAAYHNHTGAIGETFTDMDRLLAETDPDRFSVMVDVGHATKDFVELPVRERAVAFLEKYWGRIDFIEFKDWHPDTDLNTPLGEGECDWPTLFNLLRTKNYAGWITVEQNGSEGTSHERTPLECARTSRDFIKKGLGI